MEKNRTQREQRPNGRVSWHRGREKGSVRVNQQTNMIQMQRTVEQGRAIEKKMEK